MLVLASHSLPDVRFKRYCRPMIGRVGLSPGVATTQMAIFYLKYLACWLICLEAVDDEKPGEKIPSIILPRRPVTPIARGNPA